MKNIKLTEQQVKNLFLFLDRVEMKGLKEATAMIDLVRMFNEPSNSEENATPKD